MKRHATKYTDPLLSRVGRDAGIPTNNCVSRAVARALSAPNDVAEAAGWLPIVIETLRAQYRRTRCTYGLDANGSYRGTLDRALTEAGIDFRIETPPPARYGKRQSATYWDVEHEVSYQPTVAAYLRERPWIRRAVLYTNRHAAFVDHGNVYAAGSRYRVICAYIIEEDEDAREAAEQGRFDWRLGTGAEVVDWIKRGFIVRGYSPGHEPDATKPSQHKYLSGGGWLYMDPEQQYEVREIDERYGVRFEVKLNATECEARIDSEWNDDGSTKTFIVRDGETGEVLRTYDERLD